MGELVIYIHSCQELENSDVSLFGSGASDPFVVVKLDDEEKFKTEVVNNSSNPEFQTVGSVLYKEGSTVSLCVFDYDRGSGCDDLGSVSLSCEEMKEKGTGIIQKLSRGGEELAGTITFSVKFKSGALQFTQSDDSKKKALMIGINYYDLPKGKGQLSGCINDVENMKECLLAHGYSSDDIRVLTDDQEDDDHKPTKDNILNGIDWLVSEANPGDSLFFHYSGHGGQVEDKTGDEEDSKDETLIPVDFRSAGQIVDDLVNVRLVQPLPEGARLTAVMDCCHSGTGMDLPYERVAKGEIGEVSDNSTKKFLPTPKDVTPFLASLLKTSANQVFGFNQKATKGMISGGSEDDSKADVILFSGCRDDQTSADAQIKGEYSGAMTYSFLKTLNECGDELTFEMMLDSMRKILKRDGYTQVPQMSTGRPFDINSSFGF